MSFPFDPDQVTGTVGEGGGDEVGTTSLAQMKLLAQRSHGAGEAAQGEVGGRDSRQQSSQFALGKGAAACHLPPASWEIGHELVAGIEVGVSCEFADRKALAEYLEGSCFHQALLEFRTILQGLII